MRNKKAVVAAAVLASVAVIAGVWYFNRSRVLKVWVYTDFSFRTNHHEWPGLIDARFQEVNRIYRDNGARVLWKVVDSSLIDPTANVQGIDNRRANMALHLNKPTDVFLILTGVHEGQRTGSVSPFTRVAVVVDYPDKSESFNSTLLAHEMAHLFGAPQDPNLLQILEKPDSAKFSDRTVAVIRRMRDYPFDQGIDALLTPSWQKKALSAVSQDDVAVKGNAMGHAHTVVGISLIGERKNAPAIDQLRAAVAADPQNQLVHLNLAEAYTRDGQYDKAIQEARQAVQLAPDDPLGHRALGALLGRAHQPEAALQELQTAVRLQPDNSQNHVLLGYEYATMLGHIDDAVATLQEAARQDPTSSAAQTALQRTEDLKQQLQQAIAGERAEVHDHPNSPDALYRLAKLEARAGDLKNALLDLQKASDLRPDSPSIHTEMAELYLVKGDNDSAWAEVRKVRALGTEPPASLIARLSAQK